MAAKNSVLGCAQCKTKECQQGKDCFAEANNHRQLYRNNIARLHRAGSTIEAKYYCEKTRLGETILFAKQLGCSKIGLAFCVGLSNEAKVIDEIFSKHFEVISVCCKVCGIDKKDFALPQISSENREVMCNPAGQAQLLNDAETQLNVLCGLCVGHDAIFTKVSDAPVTTLIVKDRLLAHNPIGAVYCQYIRKQFNENSTDK
jgi:uncharacterized metal-binding protein